MTDEFIQELKNEIDILKSLDHPNIVKPMETFNRRRQMFIIMELCSGGDLYTRDPYSEQQVRRNKYAVYSNYFLPPPLTLSSHFQAAAITGKLLSAISYMHSRNITHRDLKFENIMFESSHPEAEIKVRTLRGVSATSWEYDNYGVMRRSDVATVSTPALLSSLLVSNTARFAPPLLATLVVGHRFRPQQKVRS